MKYPVYKEYKTSEEEWLGEVPRHWDNASLRWLSHRYAGGTPDKSNDAYWEDGTIPWINSGAVNQGIITEPSAYITEEAYLNSSAKWIPEGALVMALAGQGKTKGMAAQLGIKTTCNQSMAAIVPDNRIHGRFLYWWLIRNYKNIRNMAGGDARDGLNLEMLGSIPCPLMPIDEQKRIADFLDKKTQQIETLIAQKRELIEKLKEKRTALISRVVTRGLPPDAAKAAGLDPNPKLKPSGVDWLGDVPEHWDVVKFPHFIYFQEGPGIMAVDFYDEGVPLLRIVNLKPGYVDLDGCNYLSEDKVDTKWSHFKLKTGDLLISGSATTGLVSEVDKQSEGAIAYTGIIRLRPLRSEIIKEYIKILVGSELFFTQIDLLKTGSTIQHYGPSHLRKIFITLPPVKEQEEIVQYLNSQVSRLEGLIKSVKKAISTLQEYRSAIITDAVTGKIDVREVAA